MLTGLRAQNFKSWQDTSQIRMASLTGFFGANSSGKSALLQILLLLKQTVGADRGFNGLYAGNDSTYINLGTIQDAIHRKIFPSELIFSLDWTLKQLDTIIKSSTIQTGVNSIYKLETDKLHFDSSIVVNDSNTFLERMRYQFNSGQKDYAINVTRTNGVAATGTSDNEYKLVSENDNLHIEPNSRAYISNFYSFDDLTNELHYYLDFEFETLFRKIHYLGPLREFPKRIYLYTGEKPQDVGKRGEYTIAALLAKPEIQAAIAKHLKDLGLIYSFTLDPIAKGRREYELLIQTDEWSTPVPITDLGFGVSQILPVLTLCQYVPEGSIVILEQPEIHLHPAVQAGLADVLIDVIKTRNLQIILESHSEHLLNRLQRRIAEEVIDHDKVALYFCERDKQGVSHLTTLALDEYGNINNYPANFFGNSLGDLVAMSNAQMERDMKTETVSVD